MGHGWLWWKRAWSLVATNWVLWCLAVLVFFAVILGISLLSLFVPVLGSFVPTLFSPVLAAGLFHLAWRRWGRACGQGCGRGWYFRKRGAFSRF